MENSFHSIRKQYERGKLRESQVDTDPLRQLGLWLSDAILAECPEPTAMILSTAGKDLKPSSRIVLMKGLDEHGITFFTNYESRKGQQLQDNPQASILFFWTELERQVRIEGTVGKVSEEESDAYFASRPEASKISAFISPQSREIPGREWLEEQGSRLQEEGGRPAYWGGYRFCPDYFEFWQGREDRLHDRIIYRQIESGWKISRLAP